LEENSMNDTQLSGSIRSLPRRTASPAFTSEVMRRIRSGEQAVLPAWKLVTALAMAACLLAVLHTSFTTHLQRQRFAELRAEQQQLEAELETVKRIAREAETVVVLENDRGTRVIMDLDSAVRPASYRTYD
jgi:Tfp pilus assembly protein PilN